MSLSHTATVNVKKMTFKEQFELLEKPHISYECYDIVIKNECVELIGTHLMFQNKMLARHLYGCKQVVCVAIALSLDVDYLYSTLNRVDQKLYEHLVHSYCLEYMEENITGYAYQTSPWLLNCEQLSMIQFRDLNNMMSITSKLGIVYVDVHNTKTRFFIGMIGVQDSVPKITTCSLCFSSSKCAGLCRR